MFFHKLVDDDYDYVYRDFDDYRVVRPSLVGSFVFDRNSIPGKKAENIDDIDNLDVDDDVAKEMLWLFEVVVGCGGLMWLFEVVVGCGGLIRLFDDNDVRLDLR